MDVLPPNLTRLEFDSNSNQPLHGRRTVHVLPTSLTQPIFGNKFDQPLAVTVLPEPHPTAFWPWIQPALGGGRAASQPDPAEIGFNQPLVIEGLKLYSL